jgi:hypothetical protein
MAVRPASPIGSLAIFAARATGFLGTSFTLTLSRMASANGTFVGRWCARGAKAEG